MFFTRCDICGRELAENENRWHGRFEVPPKKDEKKYLATTHSLDVCDDCLNTFFEKFQQFLESVKYGRR